MADPQSQTPAPNLSSILEALGIYKSAGYVHLHDDSNATAAQRPSSTPGDASQPPPPGYQGALGSTTPSNSAPGYALPQPTNSGSLDLSAVKSVTQGSVSVADVMAKAEEIRAAKAAAYDGRSSAHRDDSRLSGRPSARRSRSRSRSPARREAFRDNYNPYRDERRDDSRRTANGHGRDRSYSPNRRDAYPAAARPYKPSSPPGHGSDGNIVEVITVESSLVGLIIGRQGENLRRVEQETGARVQFVTGPEGAGSQRQCKVSGTVRQVEDAKREIFRVREENPQALSAPAPAQQPPRPGSGVTGGRSQSGGPSSARGGLAEGESTMQIMVPDKTVGLIIGRGGETIRDLQDRSGCHVNIVGEQKSINGLRPVNLIGSREAAELAKDLIMEIVDSDTRTGGHQPPPRQQPVYAAPPPVPPPYDPYSGYMAAPAPSPYGGNEKINDRIMVPSDAVGMIIGKGGETIKQMQDSTGCKINVSPPSGPDIERDIGLVGSRIAIENAKRLIYEKVDVAREKSGARARGGPPPPREHDPYNPYPHHPPHSPYGQPPYGQPPMHVNHMPHGQPMHGHMPHEPPPGDPYAAYGGYQNYMAMWYAAMAQQGPPPPGGDPHRPPGQ